MHYKFELNHLKYFYYTVLEGSVVAAAETLCVQQPVVSKMIKAMEAQFGKPLFTKDGRTKKLTDFGQLVFRHCQVVFTEVGRINHLTDSGEEVRGVYNVGAAEVIVNHVLGGILPAAMEEFDGINFNVYASTQSHLLQMLEDRRLDIGLFFYVPSLSDELEVIQELPVRHHLVVAKAYQKDEKVLESFIGSREIDDTSTHKFPTVELMRQTRPGTRISFSSNSISLHHRLVTEGRGVSIMPSFMVKRELAKGTFVDLYPKEKFVWNLKVLKRKGVLLDKITRSVLRRIGSVL